MKRCNWYIWSACKVCFKAPWLETKLKAFTCFLPDELWSLCISNAVNSFFLHAAYCILLCVYLHARQPLIGRICIASNNQPCKIRHNHNGEKHPDVMCTNDMTQRCSISDNLTDICAVKMTRTKMKMGSIIKAITVTITDAVRQHMRGRVSHADGRRPTVGSCEVDGHGEIELCPGGRSSTSVSFKADTLGPPSTPDGSTFTDVRMEKPTRGSLLSPHMSQGGGPAQ